MSPLGLWYEWRTRKWDGVNLATEGYRRTAAGANSEGCQIVGLMVSGGRRGEFDKAGGRIPQGGRESGREMRVKEGRGLSSNPVVWGRR